jgi:hypothetical protein
MSGQPQTEKAPVPLKKGIVKQVNIAFFGL